MVVETIVKLQDPKHLGKRLFPFISNRMLMVGRKPAN